MINMCLTRKASANDGLRLPKLQLLWGMVTGSNIDFVELIWKVSNTKLGLERTNDKIPKRPLSFQHVIKLDTTLRNLKFKNKGTIDPVFGMLIPVVMLNDDIKDSTEFSEYLKKAARGSIPVVKGCKGLLSKKGVEIAVEQLRIPKRRQSKSSN
nr:hypothetical protein [Tanacetum cinerariifolium]